MGVLLNYLKIISSYLLFLNILTAANLDEIKDNFSDGLFDIAYSGIISAIQNGGMDSEGYALAADIAFRLDSLNKANEYLKKAIEIKDNDEYRIRWNKLDSLRQNLKEAKRKSESGLIDEAIVEYENIIDLFPDFATTFHRLGKIYYKEKDFDEAVYYYNKAREKNPYNETYSKEISNIAKKLAIEGNENYRRKDYEGAIEKYNQSIRIFPEYTEAYYRAAKCYYMLGDYESVREKLERAIQNNPTHSSSLKLYGDIERKTGNSESAISYYEQAVSHNSSNYVAHYMLGKTYYELQRNDKAIHSLNNTVAIAPTYAKAYELLGVIHLNSENNTEAIRNFELAIANDPKAYIANFRLASVYNSQKKYDLAKLAAEASIDIKKNYAASWYELGLAEKGLGNRGGAKFAFEKAAKDKKWRKNANFEIKLLEKES